MPSLDHLGLTIKGNLLAHIDLIDPELLVAKRLRVGEIASEVCSKDSLLHCHLPA